jgi:hypothetical protein
MPALPLDEAGKYVAGAYLVFLGLLLVYLAIMAARTERMRRELAELAELAERRQNGGPAEVASAPERERVGAGG